MCGARHRKRISGELCRCCRQLGCAASSSFASWQWFHCVMEKCPETGNSCWARTCTCTCCCRKGLFAWPWQTIRCFLCFRLLCSCRADKAFTIDPTWNWEPPPARARLPPPHPLSNPISCQPNREARSQFLSHQFHGQSFDRYLCSPLSPRLVSNRIPKQPLVSANFSLSPHHIGFLHCSHSA